MAILVASETMEPMMRPLVALSLSLVMSLPAAADTVLSEVSGTWNGQPDGPAFFARLTRNDEDVARLQIWEGTAEAQPKAEGAPAFDNPAIALGVFASRQELSVVDSDVGNVLQILTEFADETAAGTTILEIQYKDNQYNVFSFSHHDQMNEGGDPFDCDLNFLTGIAVENGIERKLAELTPADLDASSWTYDTPFERGYCNLVSGEE